LLVLILVVFNGHLLLQKFWSSIRLEKKFFTLEKFNYIYIKPKDLSCYLKILGNVGSCDLRIVSS